LRLEIRGLRSQHAKVIILRVRDHRKLKAFQLADTLVISVYRETLNFPKNETFGLTSQMRHAAVSVAANIVEGCARESLNEYANFLNIAFGSLRELGYYIDLTHRLSYLSPEKASLLNEQYEETARVLSGLIKSIRRTK
jgi:four helix bundle protein